MLKVNGSSRLCPGCSLWLGWRAVVAEERCLIPVRGEQPAADCAWPACYVCMEPRGSRMFSTCMWCARGRTGKVRRIPLLADERTYVAAAKCWAPLAGLDSARHRKASLPGIYSKSRLHFPHTCNYAQIR